MTRLSCPPHVWLMLFVLLASLFSAGCSVKKPAGPPSEAASSKTTSESPAAVAPQPGQPQRPSE